LNIGGELIFDDRLVKIETHTYNLYVDTTFRHNDEIRISIQQQDLYTLSCESFLYVEERLTVKRGNDESQTTFGNNYVAFMTKFDMNSMALRLIVTETLESQVLSRIMYR